MTDQRKEFRNLKSPDKIEEILDGLDLKPRTETVPLDEARGRILGGDVQSNLDIPGFTRSLMDGYAVKASDTFGAREDRPITLQRSGEIRIGKLPELTVGQGKAVEISTGAPMPEGANAVVMIEHVREKDRSISVKKSVAPGENTMNAGSDISSGELVLREGRELSPREIGVLAAMGREEIKVFSQPKVGIISTGSELVPPGQTLDYGQIYDTNGYLLQGGTEEAGALPNFLGIVKDQREVMKEIFLDACDEHDILISSGSTSAGAHDMVHQIIDEQGQILAHGIKIKPGKPTLLGVLKGTPVFCLPGNPSSAFVVFRRFVAPLIRRMGGRKGYSPPSLEAEIAVESRSEGGRMEHKFVGLLEREEGFKAYPIEKKSGSINLVNQADGYFKIPEGTYFAEQGETVRVHLLSEQITLPRLLIMGSNCIGVQRLLPLLPYPARSISRGSKGGVTAISRGIADVAGIHIISQQGYNIPYLKEYDLQQEAILIRGYTRQQGLIFRSEMSNSISRFEDVMSGDFRIINRNPGSGTRILFDRMVEDYSESLELDSDEVKSRIPGYEVEVGTHGAIVEAIEAGKADVGIGIETVARERGLEFLPLQVENFDFLCRRDTLESKAGEQFLDALTGKEFEEKISDLPGIKLTEETGQAILELP